MIAVTAQSGGAHHTVDVKTKPVLQLYVMRGCSACRRAERTLRHCERIRRLADLVVIDMGAEGVTRPPGVIGGPTTVFQGAVVALGTPDCAQLADRLETLVGAKG